MKNTLTILLFLSTLISCSEKVDCIELLFKNGKYYLENHSNGYSGGTECRHGNGKLKAYAEYKNGIRVGEWAEFGRDGGLIAKGRMLLEDETRMFNTKLIELTRAERIDVSISYEGYSESEIYDLMTISIISKDSIKANLIDDFFKENFSLMKIKKGHFVDVAVLREYNDIERLLRIKPKEY